MKIGLYVKSLEGGGAERVVSRLSYILASHGLDVTLITAYATDRHYDHAGKLVSIDEPPRPGLWKIPMMLKRIYKFKQIRKKENCDYIISFLDSPNLSNTLTRFCPGASVVSIRNYDSFNGSSLLAKLKRFVFKYTYGKADSVIACSAEIRKTVIEKLGVDPGKIHVMYNPFNSNELVAAASQDCPVEYVEFAKEHMLTLVVAGRMQHQKGYWHLPKIIAGLKGRGVDVGLLIIGDGEQKDAIQSLAASLGVKESILCCGFQKNPMAIEALADAYIMTSLFEGFPNALVEAMTIGLPLITADCKSGPSEIVTKNLASIYDYECDQGLLLPVLESQEDWSTELSETDKIWIDAIASMPLDRLASKKNASLERAKAFSYEKCYGTLITILKGING